LCSGTPRTAACPWYTGALMATSVGSIRKERRLSPPPRPAGADGGVIARRADGPGGRHSRN